MFDGTTGETEATGGARRRPTSGPGGRCEGGPGIGSWPPPGPPRQLVRRPSHHRHRPGRAGVLPSNEWFPAIEADGDAATSFASGLGITPSPQHALWISLGQQRRSTRLRDGRTVSLKSLC
jgi:hypothetical protein